MRRTCVWMCVYVCKIVQFQKAFERMYGVDQNNVCINFVVA